MKILYVEDNDDNIYMLKSRLTRAGFTVVIATDGAQGVEMAAGEDLRIALRLPAIEEPGRPREAAHDGGREERERYSHLLNLLVQKNSSPRPPPRSGEGEKDRGGRSGSPSPLRGGGRGEGFQ